MKKTGKSILALFLAVVLCLSLCVSAFAEGDAPTFTSYVSMGDSISCGFTDVYASPEGNAANWYKTSDWAYSLDVGEAFQCSNVCSEHTSFCGARVEELLMILGGSVPLDEYNSGDGFFAPRLAKMMETADQAKSEVANADLITLCIGANDISGYPLRCCGLTAEELSTAEPAALAEAVAKAVELIWQGYDNMMTYYPQLLAKIRELNTQGGHDAVIAITGIYNPGLDVTLTNETLLPIGTALSSVIARINQYLMKFRLYRLRIKMQKSGTIIVEN